MEEKHRMEREYIKMAKHLETWGPNWAKGIYWVAESGIKQKPSWALELESFTPVTLFLSKPKHVLEETSGKEVSWKNMFSYLQ